MADMYLHIVNLEKVGKEAQEILNHVQAIKDIQDELHSYRGGINVSIDFEETEGRP